MKIKITKKNISLFVSFVVVLFGFLFQERNDDSILTPSIQPTPTIANYVLSSSTSSAALRTPGVFVKVTKVVDGDTITLETGETVRYIGIDTPETVHPKKEVMCYGKEASEMNKQLVEGKIVELEKDVSNTDRYGRLLRYVWIGDVLLNEYLTREGYAISSSYPPDIKYQYLFTEAENLARTDQKGLWSTTCSL